jgi:hypothetical protein
MSGLDDTEKLNKRFNLSQQESEKQKTREDLMKEKLTAEQREADRQREAKIETIKDLKVQQEIALKMQEQDRQTADQLEVIKERQQGEINDKVAKEANSLSRRVYTITGWVRGNSAHDIQDSVKAALQPQHDREQVHYVQNDHDKGRREVDQEIERAVQKELAREQLDQLRAKNRPPEQVFEKLSRDPARETFNREATRERDTAEREATEQEQSARDEIDWDQLDRDRRSWKELAAELKRDDREK